MFMILGCRTWFRILRFLNSEKIVKKLPMKKHFVFKNIYMLLVVLYEMGVCILNCLLQLGY